MLEASNVLISGLFSSIHTSGICQFIFGAFSINLEIKKYGNIIGHSEAVSPHDLLFIGNF